MKSSRSRAKGLAGIVGSMGLMAVIVSAAVLGIMSIALIAMQPVIYYWTSAPEKLPDSVIAEHVKMYDKNGTQFAEVWSENREPVAKLDDVSKDMRNAIVSAEDKDFYNHGAVNVFATLRSLVSHSGGGSGITQQLVKNLQYYSSTSDDKTKKEATETTIARKLKELKLAMTYEQNHSKDDILLKYLNTVSIGSGNVYGIETAAQEIFGKSAKDLNLSESAALAGSVNNTSQFNLMNMSDKDTAKRVKERQSYVLDRMLANGYISKKQHDEAVKADVTTNIRNSRGGCGSSKYPFYCQYVLDYISSDTQFGADAQSRQARITQGGFAIYTQLDPELMDKSNAQVKADMGVTNRVAMPIAFVQPGGAVSAIAQNRDWGVDASKGQTQIPLAASKTQTGSTYKMITLATAVANGWTEDRLNQVYAACPWSKPGYDVPAGGIKNASGCGMQGRMGYLKATMYSLNTYYVELSTEVGLNKLIQMSKDLGLTVPDSVGSRSASFTLGVASDSPIQMAAAYATFTNKGVYCPATPVKNYGMLDGSSFVAADTYDPSTSACKAVMSPKAASIVLKAQYTNSNSAPSDGATASGSAIPGHDTGGKTGTTNNLANSAWVTTVGQGIAYANVYDPRGNFAYPLTYYTYRGYGVNGYYHSAMKTTTAFLTDYLNGKPNVKLDISNTNDSLMKVAQNNKGMKIVPDVTGMDASSALKAMHNAGMDSKVLRKKTQSDAGSGAASYSSGAVYSQSIEPGTRLSEGSKKIVELTIVQ